MDTIGGKTEVKGEIPEIRKLEIDSGGRLCVDIDPESAQKLFFRIITGPEDDPLDSLHPNPDRKIVFVGDGSRLRDLNGKTPWEMLMNLGHRPEFAKRDIENGNHYKLVVFKSNPGEEAVIATWENILKITASVYAELAPYLSDERVTSGLMCCPVGAIEFGASPDKSHPIDLGKIMESGKGHPLFMTAEKAKSLLDFELNTYADINRVIFIVRAFLYHTMSLFKLFTGSGFSMEQRGRSLIETGQELVYALENTRLDSLPGYCSLDISPEIPTDPLPPIG